MFKRDLFNADHDSFRRTVRHFIDVEIAPHHAEWEEVGVVPRALWRKAGAAGMLCCTVPELYGGAGADYLYDVVRQIRELGSFPDSTKTGTTLVRMT